MTQIICLVISFPVFPEEKSNAKSFLQYLQLFCAIFLTLKKIQFHLNASN